MFIVAPIGNTNRVTLGSTLFFCSIAAMVTGKVADEDAVPKAVNKALPMFMMYRKGIVLVISPNKLIQRYSEIRHAVTLSFYKGALITQCVEFFIYLPYTVGKTISPCITNPAMTVPK